jgi:diguanylate cyclase (GGDEF)-like protein
MFRGGSWTPETALDNTAESLDDPQKSDKVLDFFSKTPQYRGWTKDQIRNNLDSLINEVPQEEPKKPGLLQRAGEAISGAASAAQRAVSGAFQTPALPSPVSVPRQSPDIITIPAVQEATAQPIPPAETIRNQEDLKAVQGTMASAVPETAKQALQTPEQAAYQRIKAPNPELLDNVPRRLLNSLSGSGVPGSAEWYLSLKKEDQDAVDHYIAPITKQAIEGMRVGFGPLGAFGRAGVSSLTFGALGGGPEAIAEARAQQPVASMAGEIAGSLPAPLGAQTAILRGVLAVPKVAKLYQASKAGKAIVDAATRIGTTTGDQVIRLRDELTSGDPEREKRARTILLTNAIASGASVVPEAFKEGSLKGVLQPLSQAIVDGIVTTGGMATGGINALNKENIAGTITSAILSGLFGIADMGGGKVKTAGDVTGDRPIPPPKLPEGGGDAGTVRSDEAGVPDAGDVREGSQGQSSQNLQRNAQEGEAPGDEVRGVNQETLVTVRQPTIVIDKKTGLPDQNTVAKYKEEMPKEDWTISYDVDNFKSVNDQYGHAAGDKILGEVGAAAQKFFGSLPFNGREGGEEFFAHIGPDVGDSRKLANQFREYVAQNVKTPDGHPVTVSVGIGKGYYKAEDGQMHLVSDRAAYNSKGSGRNTVSSQVGVDNEGKIAYDIDSGEPVKKPYVEEFAKKQGKEAADVLFKAGRIDEATKRRIIEGFDRGQEGAPDGGRSVQTQTSGEQRTGQAQLERLPEETDADFAERLLYSLPKEQQAEIENRLYEARQMAAAEGATKEDVEGGADRVDPTEFLTNLRNRILNVFRGYSESGSKKNRVKTPEGYKDVVTQKFVAGGWPGWRTDWQILTGKITKDENGRRITLSDQARGYLSRIIKNAEEDESYASEYRSADLPVPSHPNDIVDLIQRTLNQKESRRFVSDAMVPPPKRKISQTDLFGGQEKSQDRLALEEEMRRREAQGGPPQDVSDLPLFSKERGRTEQGNLFGTRSDASAGGYNTDRLPPSPPPQEQPSAKEEGSKRVLRLRGPAIVRLYQAMASGKVPAVVRKLRAAGGAALGMATPGSRAVRLRSDIWLGPELLRTKLPRNEEESAALVEEIRSLFSEQQGVPIEDIVFKKDGRNGVFYKRDHEYHEKIGAHEIMHVADYVPDDMRRGNILGHIASLKKYMTDWIDSVPKVIGQAITAEDKRNIRKFLKDQGLTPNTQEWVDARDAALKEIADAKGLITKREVEEELKAVSQYVRPFERKEGSPYTKYRDKASELYADAGGLLLNDPDKLKNMAPTFYNAFFAYMKRKPEMKAAYDAIQKQIESGEEIEVNQQNIRKMSEEGEARLRKLRESGERKRPSPTKMFVEKNQAIYRSTEEAKRILKEKGVELNPNQDPIIQLGKYESVTGEEKAIVLKAVDVEKKLEDAGLTLQDAHEFMFEERNINDRKDIANPGDFTPEYSAEQLANLKRQLGEEKFNKLSDIVNEYRDWRQQEIVDEYIRSGMASPELAEKMKNNRQYASYLVNKYINSPPGTSGISREIHAAKGTLEGIANTFTATVMRDRAIIRGLRRNNATRALVETLKKVDETGATKEGQRFIQEAPFENGKPKEPDDTKLGLITYEEAGKEKGFWVEKDVADAINRSKKNTELELAASFLIRFMSKLNFSKRFYVPWNVGFAMANVPRDWKRSVLNLPGNTIPFSQFVTILPKYLKAIPLAARAAAGRYDPEYTKMIKQGIIPTIETRDRGYIEAPTHLEAMKREMQLAKEEKGLSGVFHKIDATASFLSAMSEIISKTAGKRYLEAGKDKLFNPYTGKKGGWTEDQIAHFTRNFVGTPSTQRGGTASNVTNALALYSSVAIQGWRSDLSLYKTGLRNERLWKVGRSLAPKAIMMAGAAGLLGKAYQEMMDAIPENDKANYNTFPLGWTSNGKVKYLRLPDTEEMRAIGGTLWKAFRTGKMGPEALTEIPGVVLNYLGGLTPSLAPGVSLPADIVSFVRGKNVEDKFRGEMAIPDKVWKATGPEGGYEREKAELKYLWNKYGPTVAYRFQGTRPSMGDTDLEKFLRLPGISGTIGRFIKVSDRGISESNTESAAKAGASAAKRSIDIDEAIIDALDTLGEKNEKPDRSSFNRVRRDLIESGVIDKRADRARAWEAWQRWTTLGIGSADARSLYQAPTKDEREAIAKHILKRKGISESDPTYRSRLRKMTRTSFISRQVLKEAEGR